VTVVAELILLASLFPRKWPRLLRIDPWEDTVLVRLGANELDATEYAEEFVEAVESCRNGLVDCAGRSVWARLSDGNWVGIT
jgi:hypothetical protein